MFVCSSVWFQRFVFMDDVVLCFIMIERELLIDIFKLNFLKTYFFCSSQKEIYVSCLAR